MTYSISFNLLFMFLAHVLGDFYLQTNSMAEKKQINWKILILHCVIYGLCFAGFIVLVCPAPFFSIVLFFLQHLAVDLFKFHVFTKQNSIVSKYPRLNQWCKDHPLVLFVSDQIMHLLAISIICVYINNFEVQYKFISFIGIYLMPLIITFFSGSAELMLRWILLFLVLWRPLSIFIELFLKCIPLPASNPPQNALNTAHTGRIIGILERWLIAFLFLLEVYEGIGFVLAAKALTRFSKLDKKDFAEYYLIGTMLSTFLCFLLSFLICT